MSNEADELALRGLTGMVFRLLRANLTKEMGVTLILRHTTDPSAFTVMSDDPDPIAAGELLQQQIDHLLAEQAALRPAMVRPN